MGSVFSNPLKKQNCTDNDKRVTVGNYIQKIIMEKYIMAIKSTYQTYCYIKDLATPSIKSGET